MNLAWMKTGYIGTLGEKLGREQTPCHSLFRMQTNRVPFKAGGVRDPFPRCVIGLGESPGVAGKRVGIAGLGGRQEKAPARKTRARS